MQQQHQHHHHHHQHHHHQQPPESAGARVAGAVAGVLRTYGRDRLELEFRLGHRARNGTFVPGVPEARWTRLKRALDASDRAKIQAPTFTDARERIANDAKLVEVLGTQENAGDARAEPVERYLMHKKRVKDVDVDLGTWCCRASMSLEVVDATKNAVQKAPDAQFKFERHKRRWSYRYRCWSIDLTTVTSNLPHQLDNDGMSYEVEIELVDTSVFFTVPMAVVAEWGLQLARDMSSLMADSALQNSAL